MVLSVRTFAGFTFSGWIATLAGWYVTEIGRQPWLVTGILRTADAAGPVSGIELGASMTSYIITYALLLVAYMVILTHIAGKGGGQVGNPGDRVARPVPA